MTRTDDLTLEERQALGELAEARFAYGPGETLPYTKGYGSAKDPRAQRLMNAISDCYTVGWKFKPDGTLRKP